MRRTTALAAVAGMAVLALAACTGGDDPPPSTSTSTTSGSGTTTPSSTTTAAPSTTALPPLSRFEDDPRVKAVRMFAYEYGKAVNAKSANYKPWLATMSPAGQAVRKDFIQGDLGYQYPGPVPFTPVALQGSGSPSKVIACMQITGFSLNPKTNQPAEKTSIDPVYVKVSKVKGAWKVDTIGDQAGTSCSKTKVVGRAW